MSKSAQKIMGGGKTELRLVTKLEEKHYAQLKAKLAKKDIDPEDSNHIVHHMFANRTRYSGYTSYREIIVESFKSLFGPLKPYLTFECRCRKAKPGSPEYKREKRFINGLKRFADEIDVIKILKTNRISKMLF